MSICIIRIILARIVFCQNAVCSKVKKQAAVFSYDPSKHLIQMILCDNPSENEIRAHMKTITADSSSLFLRKLGIREIF